MPVFSRIAAIMAAVLFILTIFGLSVRAKTIARHFRRASTNSCSTQPMIGELPKRRHLRRLKLLSFPSLESRCHGDATRPGHLDGLQAHRIFRHGKGCELGQEVEQELRTGDWHFQQFDTNGQVRRTEIAERCQSCHQSRASNDFMFTIDRMRDYLP